MGAYVLPELCYGFGLGKLDFQPSPLEEPWKSGVIKTAEGGDFSWNKKVVGALPLEGTDLHAGQLQAERNLGLSQYKRGSRLPRLCQITQ